MTSRSPLRLCRTIEHRNPPGATTAVRRSSQVTTDHRRRRTPPTACPPWPIPCSERWTRPAARRGGTSGCGGLRAGQRRRRRVGRPVVHDDHPHVDPDLHQHGTQGVLHQARTVVGRHHHRHRRPHRRRHERWRVTEPCGSGPQAGSDRSPVATGGPAGHGTGAADDGGRGGATHTGLGRPASRARRSAGPLQGTTAPGRARAVAITFDDGPEPAPTPRLLDELSRLGIRATFFVVGRRADAHPSLIRRMVDEGHAVGSHSFSHPDPWRCRSMR